MTRATARAGIPLANPLLVYTLEWVGILALLDLQLTSQLVPVPRATRVLIGWGIAAFAVIYCWLVIVAKRRADRTQDCGQPYLKRVLQRFVRQLLIVFAVGTLFEVVVSGGFPMYWLLIGRTDLDYRDFGVFTLHGFLSACYLLALAALCLEYSVSRQKKTLVKIGALFLWPILVISRGLMLWAILEAVAVYLVIRRVTVRRVMTLGLIALVTILVFGIVGDARMGAANEGALLAMVPDEKREAMSRLPSGFLWVYIYSTAPLNNVNAAIDDLKPNYVPYYSTVLLLPTVIRSHVYDTQNKNLVLPLVNEAFNTSTWYANFLADFGVPGTIAVTTVLLSIATFFYLRARDREAWAILAYAPLFQSLVLSGFADTFTSLVTVFQVVLALHFRRRVARAAQAMRRRTARTPMAGPAAEQLPA